MRSRDSIQSKASVFFSSPPLHSEWFCGPHSLPSIEHQGLPLDKSIRNVNVIRKLWSSIDLIFHALCANNKRKQSQPGRVVSSQHTTYLQLESLSTLADTSQHHTTLLGTIDSLGILLLLGLQFLSFIFSFSWQNLHSHMNTTAWLCEPSLQLHKT
jgi:hypothetical protein